MIDIIVLALVLGYCVFIIVRHYREAKLAQESRGLGDVYKRQELRRLYGLLLR